MPFESKAQQRWMFANKPRMAERWADHTPDIKSLPEKKGMLQGALDMRKTAEQIADEVMYKVALETAQPVQAARPPVPPPVKPPVRPVRPKNPMFQNAGQGALSAVGKTTGNKPSFLQ